jgi:ATP synthase protein I
MAGNGDGNLGRALSYGLEIAVGATLGYLVGSWFDRHHGTSPWGLLIGVMLGLGAGMYLLIKDAISMNKD